jgi:hypothetical protein
MVAIIALLLVGGVFVLGGSIQAVFNGGADCVTSPSDCGDSSGNGSGTGSDGGGNPAATTTTRPASTTTTTTAATGS